MSSTEPHPKEAQPADLSGVARFVEARGTVTDAELLAEATRLRIPYQGSRDLRRKLRSAHPEVDWEVRGREVRWSAVGEERLEAPVRRPARIVFSDWVGEKNPRERAALSDELNGRAAELDAPLRAVATAAGALPGKVDWAAVPVDPSTDPGVLEVLLTNAINACADQWLVDAAVTLSGARAARARSALLALDDATRSEIAASALERWTADPLAQRAPGQVRRLEAIIDGKPTAQLVSRALDVGVAVAQRQPATLERDRLAIRVAALAFSGGPDALVRALQRESVDIGAIRVWLDALATADKADVAVRRGILDAVGRSNARSALTDASALRELDLDALGALLEADWARPMLAGALDTAAKRAVRAACGSQLGPILAAATQHPVLETLLPMDLLERLGERDEPSARLVRRLVDAGSRRRVEEERRRSRERLAELEHVLETERERALAAEHIARDAAEREASAKTELRERLGERVALRDAELQQARIDVVRRLVELVEAVRDTLGALGRPVVLTDLVAAVTRDLDALDVEVVGVPGDVVEYDRTVHEALEIPAGSPVEVISPTYVARTLMTPLVYGRVRPTRAGGQEWDDEARAETRGGT